MANTGLKSYTKQISQTIGNVAQVSVNVNKSDANMHIVIPIIQTLGPNPINLSLIFNYQELNNNRGFGKGCNLSTYKNIKAYTNRIEVTEADGSTIEYKLDKNETYYSKESALELSKSIYVSDDGEYETFSMKDQQGNIMYFDENYTLYPTEISYINGFRTRFDGPNMDNGHGAKIKFTLDSNYMYSKITYEQDEGTLYYVDLLY
ncbi:MAG: hypothetical protein K2J85_07305, partial [Anaeroplasmataceae bacterium]|nr:hypothetical protein [Anaeroplasmataceae bacterium]